VAAGRGLPWGLYKAGYPTCCEQHARHYWMVIWDLGPDYDTSFKMSLS